MVRFVRRRLWLFAAAVVTVGIAVICMQAGPRGSAAQAQEGQETSGSLAVLDEKGEPKGYCPLKHTDVRTRISGFVAEVEVTQQFHNPYKEKIEAVYTFPLSQDAAVFDMTMRVGERTIRGLIKRREEAQQIYQAARERGQVASLLEQERPNIFTQSVANIMPGEEVDITIRYAEVLKYEDGWFEFVFPMVVGPRYIPGAPTSAQPETPPEMQGRVVQPSIPEGSGTPSGTGWSPDTTQVPDASRITPPVTAKGTRAGHDISLTVRIDAGAPIRDCESKLHKVAADLSGRTAIIKLEDQETIPNKDFILRYTTATEAIGDAVLTHASDTGGFVTLVLQPPARVRAEQITPKEMVFVLDTSGSMQGYPIEKAKETMMYSLDNLNPRDTFNLITFSGDTRILFEQPVAATPGNIGKAQEFLAGREGSGGTEMMKAIVAALAPSDSQDHLRTVVFMTDGYVGNDMEIIGEIQKHPNARVFSFGIGQSVNRFLLDNMAAAGRGEVEYVTLGTHGKTVAERFYEKMRNPVLTDIEVDWGGLAVDDVYPRLIPDLFSSKPVVVHAHYTQPGQGEVTLRGKVVGETFNRRIPVRLPAREPANEVLAQLWARARIAFLMNQDWTGMQTGQPKPEIKEAITDLGLTYRLVTQYTSFVAVEEMTITEGGKPRTIAVPVEMPEGVSYVGVFGEQRQALASRARRAAPGMGGGFGGGMPGAAGPAGPAGPAGAMMAPSAMPAMSPGMGMGMDDVGPVTEESLAEAKTRMTPEDFRKYALERKLAEPLRGLAEKVKTEGANGDLTVGSVVVKGGMVEVSVWLAEDSDATIAAMEQLGLTVLARAKAVKMVIGRVSVEKLEELALLDGVQFVGPSAG